MEKNRILIVEDDSDIADVIAMNLQYSNYILYGPYTISS